MFIFDVTRLFFCAQITRKTTRILPATLIFCSFFLSPRVATPGGPRMKIAQRRKRYDYAGKKKPSAYDKNVRRISKPLRGYDRACLRRLDKAGVKYSLLGGVKGVRTPIEILSKRLGGVNYIRHWSNKRRFILDCRFAEALVERGKRIRLAGVASVYYSSSWRYSYKRGTRNLSRHASGMALDITAIDGAFGYASVVQHYEKGRWGCGCRNKTKRGKVWRAFYCALTQHNGFRRILTPDNGPAHRDHFHVEGVRPSMRLEEEKRKK